MDVILFDEFGMLNAELWSAFDKVMQWVKGNNLPFGGILCLLSGDPNQLPPPEGTSVWKIGPSGAQYYFCFNLFFETKKSLIKESYREYQYTSV